ncbi:hypothetical protein AB1K62_06015 [Parasphingorhabdus sp. JC815]|uniref:hypothetical protein n=1 Tax=Parasphingorhabdus sp. JC815 TaxID=3232140 RepID=UPI00345AA9EA
MMLGEMCETISSNYMEENVTDMDFTNMNETNMGQTNRDGPVEDNMWGGQILLICDDQQLRALFTHAIELVGGRWTALSLDCTDRDLNQRMNIAAVIIQVTRWDSHQQEALGRAERFCEALSLPLLIRTNLNLLDNILASVQYSHVEHLLSDNVAELFVTLEHRTSQSGNSLFTDRDKIDLSDLKKISIDVERIARALVKLSGAEHPQGERPLIDNPFQEPMGQPASGPHVHAPSADYITMPSSDANHAEKSVQNHDDTASIALVNESPSRPISAEEVRGLIKARRLRDQYFDAELFADPAWDMLLDLLAAQLEGIQVAVSSLCIAANVPPTTALRWIKTMTEENIFLRKADDRDGRRIFIELSDEATAGMVGYFEMVRRSGLMII